MFLPPAAMIDKEITIRRGKAWRITAPARKPSARPGASPKKAT